MEKETTSSLRLDELGEREKSVLLARAMGWLWERRTDKNGRAYWEGQKISGHLFINPNHPDYLVGGEAGFDKMINLYYPHNMSYSWLVLNWALSYPKGASAISGLLSWHLDNAYPFSLWGYEKAQSIWLDKILELAIEAGLIEIDNANAKNG